MKNKLLFAAILLLTGCVSSLNPLYTAEDLIKNENLPGKWTGSEGEEKNYWEFAPAEEPGMFETTVLDHPYRYTLTYQDDGAPAKFEAHLLKLEKHTFLNLYPIEYEEDNDLLNLGLLPVHTFFKAEITPDKIILEMMDVNYLAQLKEENRLWIPHHVAKGGIVLTGSTEELQKFVLQHIHEEGAFGDPLELIRE